MTDKKYLIKVFILLFSSLLFSAFTTDREGDKKQLNKNSNVQTAGDAYRLYVNKLNMGMNNKGVMADVNIGGDQYGIFDGKVFLYSGGFFMSGFANGVLFGNAMATASRLEDYKPGPAGGTDTEKYGMYVIKSTDPPFGAAWIEWKDAVDLGAYFYDGDRDGIYNPTDKNGNGIWDQESLPGAADGEDAPDLLGDETVWCVYNDGIPGADRAAGFRENNPLGIEIRQTVWGYATSGDLGNILFLRYSITNTGLVAPVLTDVNFGVWADADLGDAYDDLVGSDTTLSSAFIFNDGADTEYGNDPPAFLIDFFQGPWNFTGNPEDTAYNVKGLLLGVEAIPGAKNLGLSSFVHYIQSDPDRGDPDNTQQMRNYMLGFGQDGNPIDPCNDIWGTVLQEDCNTIDPRFWYSGDPVSLSGWINTGPVDQRMLQNTGPFDLEAGKPVDIVVAYVVGRANSALNSLKETKRIDRAAQFVYQNNFNYPSPPPVVTPVYATDDGSITLTWETTPQMNYGAKGQGYDMVFEGYEVKMYNSNSTSDFEGGQANSVIIASYDVANDISNVLIEDPVSLQVTLRYEKGIQLDSAIYSDPETGRVSLKIVTDPFTNGPIIKGKPYFISIMAYALNREEIVKLDALGNYLIPGTAAVGQIATIPVILNDGVSGVGVVPGKDTYAPYKEGVTVEQVAGGSTSEVKYSIVDRTKTTDNDYEVTFQLDSASTLYNLFYQIKNKTADQIIFDSLQFFDTYDVRYLADGVMLNVGWVEPGVDSVDYTGGERWYTPGFIHDSVGVFYVGRDLADPNGLPEAVSQKNSTAISVNSTRRVEIRFGQPGKAYRYVRKPVRFIAGGGIQDSAFVDVPFQAWVKDDAFGEEYQLAVGFTETANVQDTLGRPDGIYDPGTNVAGSREYIIIFNAPYDPTGSQVVYTGTGTGTAAQRTADLGNGYTMDPNNPASTDSLKLIARSPYFDAMYVVGLQRSSDAGSFSPVGNYNININYPLTPKDVYSYNVDVNLTNDEQKLIFEKVNVFPNPLFAYNENVGATGQAYDDPYVTFSNLPDQVTIKIFTLSGSLIRTLEKNDVNPFLTWDLKNQDALRVASGMYLAIVSSPLYGEKVLKFGIIMPQKQILKY